MNTIQEEQYRMDVRAALVAWQEAEENMSWEADMSCYRTWLSGILGDRDPAFFEQKDQRKTRRPLWEDEAAPYLLTLFSVGENLEWEEPDKFCDDGWRIVEPEKIRAEFSRAQIRGLMRWAEKSGIIIRDHASRKIKIKFQPAKFLAALKQACALAKAESAAWYKENELMVPQSKEEVEARYE